MLGSRLLRATAIALPLLLLTGCPKQPRTVLVDGREVPYEEAARASFDRAEESFNKKEWRTALGLYEAFGKDFPKSSLADDAVYRMGVIHEQLNDIPSAGRAFQNLIANYPSSDLAGEARFRLGVAYFRAARALSALACC